MQLLSIGFCQADHKLDGSLGACCDQKQARLPNLEQYMGVASEMTSDRVTVCLPHVFSHVMLNANVATKLSAYHQRCR